MALKQIQTIEITDVQPHIGSNKSNTCRLSPRLGAQKGKFKIVFSDCTNQLD